MYILIVSIACAVMLGAVYQMAYGDIANAVLVAFLLFVAIDSGLRAIMNKPSWAVRLFRNKKGA